MKLISKKTIAAMLDVTTRTIERMIEAGEFPAATHSLPGGQPRWFLPVVEGWMMTQRTATTPPADRASRSK